MNATAGTARWRRLLRRQIVGPFARLVAGLVGKRRWLEFRWRQGALPTNAYYDALTGLIIRRLLDRDAVAVDIGCHRGEVLELMLERLKNGRVAAFEPIPARFAELAARFADDDRVRLFKLALSDRTGQSEFNLVISNDAYSGFRRRRYDRPIETDTTIIVDTDRLEDVLARESMGPVRLIKIDVEGAELEVLRGAEAVLRADRPAILFEHGPGAADIYGTTPDMLLDLLAGEHDYRVYRLGDWLAGRPALDRASFVDEFHHGRHYFFLALVGH